MCVMKMGNLVPRQGISGILDQCATIIPHRLPDVITLPMPTCLFGSLSERSVQITTPIPLELLTITYIQVMALHIQTQGRFNNYTAHSVYRIMVKTTGVMGAMQMGNIVPRVGIEPTPLAFHASVLPCSIPCRLPDVTTIYLSMRLLA